MSGSRSDWLLSAPVTATNPKADTPLFPYLVRLLRGEDLNAKEASAFFRVLMDKQTGSNQIAAAITALTTKGETGDEIAGMAAVMRSAALRVGGQKKLFDISGTGTSPTKTFNVSTAAALVAAGAGLVIAKQSLRGHSSRTGSADVLAELGVKVAADQASADSCISGVGLGFLNGPKFHPAMTRIANVRSSLGIRTCLNVLGLLANPANVQRRLIGVWHPSMIEPVAQALSLLGTQKAWVVHGEDGLDEITLNGKTFIGTVEGRDVKVYKVTPKDFGLRSGPIEHLRVSTAKESAAIISDVLASRRRDAARSLVVLNAAAALYVGGVSKDPMQAARLAEQSIDSGMAQNKLERLIQVSSKR
jgi:anthranilate phosphoribosyltransferase